MLSRVALVLGGATLRPVEPLSGYQRGVSRSFAPMRAIGIGSVARWPAAAKRNGLEPRSEGHPERDVIGRGRFGSVTTDAIAH